MRSSETVPHAIPIWGSEFGGAWPTSRTGPRVTPCHSGRGFKVWRSIAQRCVQTQRWPHAIPAQDSKLGGAWPHSAFGFKGKPMPWRSKFQVSGRSPTLLSDPRAAPCHSGLGLDVSLSMAPHCAHTQGSPYGSRFGGAWPRIVFRFKSASMSFWFCYLLIGERGPTLRSDPRVTHVMPV